MTDLSPLKDLQNLQSLDLSGNQIVDLGPLAGLTRLQYLNLAENRVEKLEPLGGLKELNALDLSANQVVNLKPIAGLSRLASLYLGRNKVVDLGPIAGLTRVSTLNLSENQVEDLAALAKLPDLDLAVLDRNKVSDLGPLVQAAKSAPAGSSRWAFLRLYLRGNPLSDAAKGEQFTRPPDRGRADRALTGAIENRPAHLASGFPIQEMGADRKRHLSGTDHERSGWSVADSLAGDRLGLRPAPGPGGPGPVGHPQWEERPARPEHPR